LTVGFASEQVDSQVATVSVAGPEAQVTKRYWQYFSHWDCEAGVQPAAVPTRSSPTNPCRTIDLT
jgi:CRISPR/Cas system-associated endonuclease Cas1